MAPRAPQAAKADKVPGPVAGVVDGFPPYKPPPSDTPETPASPVQPEAKNSEAVQVKMSAADRENPEKLTGEALRRLAHQRGVARSEFESMSDEKLRLQLRYITNRQYAEAD